jgi:hypothetical protein
MSNKNWQSLALPLLYGVLVVHLFKFLCLCCDVNCASYLAPNTGPIKVYCICMRKNFRTITRLVDY